MEGTFDRIVVAGGDGTLNRVINFLHDKNAMDRFPLGVVPLGTCNDFARMLRIPSRKISKALGVITKNHLKSVSVARVNNHCFVNNAGFGKKNPSEKRKSPIAVIREMAPARLRAQWDGGFLEGSFFMMLCANAPYFSGGLHFSKKSNPSDRLLEFYFVRKMFKINLALRLLFGRAKLPLRMPLFSKNIIKVQAERLDIRTQEPVSIVLDGEPVPELSEITEARFEISGRCNFLVPK
jgi:diacylglycerol kinase family enzyme